MFLSPGSRRKLGFCMKCCIGLKYRGYLVAISIVLNFFFLIFPLNHNSEVNADEVADRNLYPIDIQNKTKRKNVRIINN